MFVVADFFLPLITRLDSASNEERSVHSISLLCQLIRLHLPQDGVDRLLDGALAAPQRGFLGMCGAFLSSFSFSFFFVHRRSFCDAL